MKLEIADMFCGAGGTSTGAMEAAELLGYSPRLTAINHWPVAIETHKANHPGARHLCSSLDNIDPRALYGEGELDVLWASPECTHHSVARGGRPINDQSRATAWCVVRWAEALRPGIILVENVPEFLTWGAIGSNGRPLKSRKGSVYVAWRGALESLGYRVDQGVFCAANYGDPTTRRRLFVQAVRGRRKIVWPEPTHARMAERDLFAARREWVPARQIIDWSLQGNSIFERARPLSPKTMRRIWSGLEKFGLRRVSETASTEATSGAIGLVEPFLIEMRGTSDSQCRNTARDIGQPLGTVTAGGGHHGLVEPFLLTIDHVGRGSDAARGIDEPLSTVCTKARHAVVSPFLVEYYGNGRAQSVDVPLGTVTTKERFGLVRPVVVVRGQEYLLDIRFRMLRPYELAAAQGFRKSYVFRGNQSEWVKQIGNAVPRRLARAHVLSALSQRSDVGEFLREVGDE